MSPHKELQLVIMNCPYRTWEREMTQKLFSRMISLKLRGYQQAYGMTVLPIDSSDFVATHLLVCERIDGELRPLMGFRSIETARCTEFSLPFTGLNVLRSAKNSELHLRYLESLMEECGKAHTPLCYLSSWTIDPDIRVKNKALVFQLAPLFSSLIYFQHMRISPVRLLAAGVLQFRVPNILEPLGFEPIRYMGSELSPLGMAFLHDTPALIMDLKTFTPYAAQQARKYQSLWENRIVLSENEEIADKDLKQSA